VGRIAYVNGRYTPHGDAVVHVEDRGFQFADGVYEYFAVFSGRLADAEGHLERLWRSLSELSIRAPMSEAALLVVLHETVRRNRIKDGAAYVQITRGTARRDHAFPHPSTPPSVVVTAKTVNYAAEQAKAARGVAVLTRPDNRWGRCDIKTIGLLPNALAKQAAREAGAYEAWLVDELGFITEGASTTAWIVDADGALCTRDTNANILRGITRKSLIELAADAGFEVTHRPFTVEDVKHANEAFMTAASALVLPVVTIDGATIGDGQPGPVGIKLRALYEQNARATAR
jgi:D-alanine transaminase